MLCMYSVKNFRSIRDEITLDMQAAALSEHIERIIHTSDGEDYLPVSAIYGPNGGGKSTVLLSLYALRSKIMRPIHSVEDDFENADLKVRNTLLRPFKFSETAKNEPTEFEIFFRTLRYEYKYIIHLLKDNVTFESLDRKNLSTNRPTKLFIREGDKIILRGALSRIVISKGLSDTIPLISYLGITYNSNAVVKDVLRWFDDGILFLNYGNPLQELRLSLAESKKFKELVIDMMKECGLDIDDYRVEKKAEHSVSVYTYHHINDKTYELTLGEESSGTQKLFGMVPYFVDSLLNGKTLVVDELDAKLHPSLLQHIIDMFSDMSINTRGAQLIFTSHDLSTMNNEVFRRDEIWFVAKGNDENSVLYSLSDFKDDDGKSVRKDEAYGKRYLEGKYGADPYLQRIIDWSQNQ